MLKQKLIYLLPVLSAILVVGGSSKAQAQITDGLRVKIPFAFHAGQITLPSGNYTIRVVDVEANLIEIKNDNGHSAALVQTMNGERSISKTSELLFDHSGEDYYLEKIFGQYGDSSVEVIAPGDGGWPIHQITHTSGAPFTAGGPNMK